jgi:colicin import membrane protein
MPISQEAQDARPKLAQNAYFFFRTEKLAELKGDPNRVQMVKDLWDNLDEAEKNKMDDEYHQRKEQQKIDYEAWRKKYNITDDDLKDMKEEKADKKKNKKRSRDTEDEEERKPVKTKGTKETKEEKKREEEKKRAEQEKKREEESKEKARKASKTLDKGKSKKEEPKVEKKKGKN